MAYRKNQTNSQIVALALCGAEGETTTGNMSTSSKRGRRYIGGTGYMPKSWAALISERAEAGAVLQVIRSYTTPIAWLDRDYGWVIPCVSCSVTTSTKHQSQLYRLHGTMYYMPHDATLEDARRVLAGELVFTSKGYGNSRVFTGTVPGPNYTPEV